MPIEITATGADDIVLAQVAADAGHPVTHAGSTRNRIEQVAGAAGVGAVPQFSDRNAIEWLAGLMAGYVSCVYAIGDQLADAQAMNPLTDGVATVSVDGLTASYVIQSALVTSETYNAAQVGAAEAAITFEDISEGLHGVQMDIGSFPVSIANSGYLAGYVFIDSALAPVLQAYVVSSATFASGYQVMLIGSAGPVSFDVAAKPASVGLTFDHENSLVTAIADGVELGTTSIAGNGTLTPLGAAITEFSGNDAGNQGDVLQVTLITNANDMDAAQFVAGAADICGNAVAA